MTTKQIQEILREEYPHLFPQEIERLSKTCVGEKWFDKILEKRLAPDLRKASHEIPNELEDPEKVNGWVPENQIVQPEYPQDEPVDVFLERLQAQGYSREALKDCAIAFREFWKEWTEIQGNPSRIDASEGVVRLLQAMCDSEDNNTALTAWCYMFVLQLTDKSQGQIAELFWGEHAGKKQRATVNARISRIKEELQLRKSRGMKSDAARETYAERQVRIHGRINIQKQEEWKKNKTPFAAQVEEKLAAK